MRRIEREAETIPCLRCEMPLPYRGRRRKWCDDCRTWAHLGSHLRMVQEHLTELGDDEGAVTISELRERLNIGEDLFPIDRGMSTAEYASKVGVARHMVRPFRGIVAVAGPWPPR